MLYESESQLQFIDYSPIPCHQNPTNPNYLTKRLALDQITKQPTRTELDNTTTIAETD